MRPDVYGILQSETMTPYAKLHAWLNMELPEPEEEPHRKAYFDRMFSKALTPRQKEAMRLWLGWHGSHPNAHGNYQQVGRAMEISGTAAKSKIINAAYRLLKHAEQEAQLTNEAEQERARRRWQG